jgi:hypothetical protein
MASAQEPVMKKLSTILLASAALVFLAVACSSSDDPTGGGSGQVRILLTDAPLDLSTVSAVNVTLTEFLLYPADEPEDGSGIVMSTPGEGSETLNLLDYQDGQTTLVASVEIPEGSYEKLRLRVAAAELVHDDDGDPDTSDVTEEIFIPSGKVDVPLPFSVAAGESMEITIDFDAQASVKVNTTSGNHPYILRPVIVPVSMESR